MLDQSNIYVDIDALIALRQQLPDLSNQYRRSLDAGNHTARLRGHGLDFEELKPYRSGDDVRLIDWRLTQRTGKPYVRVFNEEREFGRCLLIDQRIDMFFSSQSEMKSVTAAKCAALLGWQAICGQDKLSVNIFNDSVIDLSEVARSDMAWLTRLRRLVELNNELNVEVASNAERINSALTELQSFKLHEQVLYIISDFTGISELGLRAVSELAQYNEVCLIQVYDPLEASLNSSDSLPLSDGKQHFQLNASHANFDVAMTETFKTNFDTLSALEQSHAGRIFHCGLDVEQDLVGQLRAFGLLRGTL